MKSPIPVSNVHCQTLLMQFYIMGKKTKKWGMCVLQTSSGNIKCHLCLSVVSSSLIPRTHVRHSPHIHYVDRLTINCLSVDGCASFTRVITLASYICPKKEKKKVGGWIVKGFYATIWKRRVEKAMNEHWFPSTRLS